LSPQKISVARRSLPRTPRVCVKVIEIGSSLLEALAGERVLLIVRLLSRSEWRGAQLIALIP